MTAACELFCDPSGGERFCFPGSFAPESLFPADLREWFDVKELAAIVAGALPSTPGQGRVSEENRCGAQHLLALVIFCYATARYASREIADDIESQGIVLSAGDWYDASCIRRFRRANRVKIERLLAEVLLQAQARAERNSSAWSTVSLGGNEAAQALQEAKERVRRAVQVDCWDADE